MDAQIERAYQKQQGIFVNGKRVLSKQVAKKGANYRWYKEVGLGFKTPREGMRRGCVCVWLCVVFIDASISAIRYL